MTAMENIAFRTAGNGPAVLSTIGSALSSLGYSITPHADGWGARAEVGSAAARAFAGGFARRNIVDYRVTQGDAPGTTAAVITPGMTGMGGGLIGMNKAKKEMASIQQTVGTALQQAGLLV